MDTKPGTTPATGLSASSDGMILNARPDASPIPLSSWRSPRLEAIVLMCVAVSLFSCIDTSAKYLLSHSDLDTTQVVWMRFLGQFSGMVILLGPASVPWLLTTKKLKHQLARSLLMVACTALNFIAIQYLRLDQTVTIVFLAPLVVAALAGPVLGEWVGPHRLAAIVVGFLGILVVVRPGLADMHPAIIAAFLSMLAYAAFMLLTRYLSDYDPPLVTLFYAMLAGTIGGAPLALAHWVWPATLFDWTLLLSLGAWGGLGHYLFILAYRRAPASTVTPFLYAQLLSMVALGYIVFGDVPDQWTLVGSAIIVASGLYLVHRERVQGADRPRAAAAE